MIVNGVMWVVSSGEVAGKTAAATLAQSKAAVLYALDAASGKELWNSGKTMTSFTHSGGLSAGAGQLYVQTHDGVLYAFGVPIEH